MLVLSSPNLFCVEKLPKQHLTTDALGRDGVNVKLSLKHHAMKTYRGAAEVQIHAFFFYSGTTQGRVVTFTLRLLYLHRKSPTFHWKESRVSLTVGLNMMATWSSQSLCYWANQIGLKTPCPLNATIVTTEKWAPTPLWQHLTPTL